MSGGVDSSVTAHLLAREGHELLGVRFSLWSDPLAPPMAQLLPSKCCNPQTVHRANAVAADLGFPLQHRDISDAFKRDVVDPFLREYERGRTPNPCVLCNRVVKFATLFAMADELRCDAVATGHYARILRDAESKPTLHEATDSDKDQSYFLYAIAREQLQRILFPLGDMHKADVIALARSFGVPLPKHYEESQDVCFYPEKEPAAFLRRHLPHTKAGPIRTLDGTEVGEHRGLPFYTIGQRKGLGIGGLTIPLHVVRKDIGTNTVFVAPSGADCESEILGESPRWPGGAPPEETDIPLHVRVNSQGRRHPGTLRVHGDRVTFRLAEPIRGIAPGQSAVFYRGTQVIGGAVIRERN